MTQEQQDAAVQSMRDQGIADACAGRAARCWSTPHGDVIFVRRESGWIVMLPPRDSEYPSAFAYARAYEAEKGAE